MIRQTAEAHAEIVELLSALRKENDLMVVADSLIVKLPEGKTNDWLDKAIELNPSSDGLRWALSTGSRVEKLIDYVTAAGELYQVPESRLCQDTWPKSLFPAPTKKGSHSGCRCP